MKNVPLSIIITPIILLLLSGAGLILLYSTGAPISTELKPAELREVKTVLDRIKGGRKAFKFIKQQNIIISRSNKALKSCRNLTIKILWSVMGFSIIILYFFLLWWKNRYNKEIKKVA